MRSTLDHLLALVAGLLPRRVWDDWDLPILNMAFGSALLTMLAGFAIGIRGYFVFLAQLYGDQGLSMLEIARRQVAGELPETAAVSAIPMAAGMLAPVSFALASPVGLLATYLVCSGFFRIGNWWVGEPQGDTILTILHAGFRRSALSHRARSDRNARLALEREEEPDRRYDGAWAGLDGVDFVVVAARRKPGWTRGTWIITSEGWFTLGEPFDRPMPQGLRTIYPLSLQTNTLDVLRKGVSYELPPLRSGRANPVNRGHHRS